MIYALADHLFRIPAKNMEGRRGNIMQYPINPGATYDVDTVLGEKLEIDLVLTEHTLPHPWSG